MGKITKKINISELIVVLLMLLGCGGISTGDYLSGEFVSKNSVAPTTVLPYENQRIYSSESVLQWSPQSMVLNYEVEVSLTPDFSRQIQGSPFIVEAPDSFLTLSNLDARKYYWHVKADRGQFSQTASFDVFDDSIYVYSPDGIIPDNSGKLGNISSPFQTIQGAISESVRQTMLRGETVNKIKIAAKVNSQGQNVPYSESVNLVENVVLYGGYRGVDSNGINDFSESTRNIQGNKTIIKGIGSVESGYSFAILASGIVGVNTTQLDGLYIVGENNNSAGLYIKDSKGILVTNCSITGSDITNSSSAAVQISSSSSSGNPITSNVIIKNCTITAGKPVYGACSGIYTTPGVNVTLQDSSIISNNPYDWKSPSTSTYGFYNQGNSTVKNSIITSGASTQSYGVMSTNFLNSALTIDNSIIISSGCIDETYFFNSSTNSTSSSSLYLFYDSTPTNKCTINITNSVLRAAGAGIVTGIILNCNADLSLYNNTIIADATRGVYYTSSSYTARFNKGNIQNLLNNIFISFGVVSNSYGCYIDAAVTEQATNNGGNLYFARSGLFKTNSLNPTDNTIPTGTDVSHFFSNEESNDFRVGSEFYSFVKDCGLNNSKINYLVNSNYTATIDNIIDIGIVDRGFHCLK